MKTAKEIKLMTENNINESRDYARKIIDEDTFGIMEHIEKQIISNAEKGYFSTIINVNYLLNSYSPNPEIIILIASRIRKYTTFNFLIDYLITKLQNLGYSVKYDVGSSELTINWIC